MSAMAPFRFLFTPVTLVYIRCLPRGLLQQLRRQSSQEWCGGVLQQEWWCGAHTDGATLLASTRTVARQQPPAPFSSVVQSSQLHCLSLSLSLQNARRRKLHCAHHISCSRRPPSRLHPPARCTPTLDRPCQIDLNLLLITSGLLTPLRQPSHIAPLLRQPQWRTIACRRGYRHRRKGPRRLRSSGAPPIPSPAS